MRAHGLFTKMRYSRGLPLAFSYHFRFALRCSVKTLLCIPNFTFKTKSFLCSICHTIKVYKMLALFGARLLDGFKYTNIPLDAGPTIYVLFSSFVFPPRMTSIPFFPLVVRQLRNTETDHGCIHSDQDSCNIYSTFREVSIWRSLALSLSAHNSLFYRKSTKKMRGSGS